MVASTLLKYKLAFRMINKKMKILIRVLTLIIAYMNCRNRSKSSLTNTRLRIRESAPRTWNVSQRRTLSSILWSTGPSYRLAYA